MDDTSCNGRGTDTSAGVETDYNYSRFPVESDVEDFQRFPRIVNVGTSAPDPVLTDLDTMTPVRLSEITRSGITVLEFGSLT